MPKKGTMLEFKNYHRSEKVPFIVYADFECFIKPIQSCDPDYKESYTKQYQKHEPSSFCYYTYIHTYIYLYCVEYLHIHSIMINTKYNTQSM